MTNLDFVHQIKVDIDNNDTLDKLYILCIGSKSTQVVQKDKNITPITDQLEEMYANL